jgi:CRP/FNR family transcriptional regulator
MSFHEIHSEAEEKTARHDCCPICAELPGSSLAEISAFSHEKNFKRGDILMQEGDASAGFFLVLSGKIRVFKCSPDGKEKLLLLASRGMTFGESALFGAGRYQEMAMAQTAGRILFIPKDPFFSVLGQSPALSRQIMETLSLWIKRLAFSVEDEAFHSARHKTARYLLELSSQERTPTLILEKKKKDIAEELGLAPETFSRSLRELSREGIIEVEHKTIRICDVRHLREEVG